MLSVMSAKTAMMDLSVTKDNPLYAGCEIEEVAGRLIVKDYSDATISTIGRNADAMTKHLMSEGVEALTLTGGTAIWVYLVVFHTAAHRFKEIYYDNGQPGGRRLIAAH
jgi:hypothetical protein